MTLARAEISESELGQMNVSTAWFAKNYPGAKTENLMFHAAGNPWPHDLQGALPHGTVDGLG